jgi:hypothetical protein
VPSFDEVESGMFFSEHANISNPILINKKVLAFIKYYIFKGIVAIETFCLLSYAPFTTHGTLYTPPSCSIVIVT